MTPDLEFRRALADGLVVRGTMHLDDSAGEAQARRAARRDDGLCTSCGGVRDRRPLLTCAECGRQRRWRYVRRPMDVPCRAGCGITVRRSPAGRRPACDACRAALLRARWRRMAARYRARIGIAAVRAVNREHQRLRRERLAAAMRCGACGKSNDRADRRTCQRCAARRAELKAAA